MPLGIDVGIAHGVASYGLSGTKFSKKMMAWGRPVALARAIQYQAKQLRNSEGYEDRVIATPEFSAIAKSGRKLIEYKSDIYVSKLACDAITEILPREFNEAG